MAATAAYGSRSPRDTADAGQVRITGLGPCGGASNPGGTRVVPPLSVRAHVVFVRCHPSAPVGDARADLATPVPGANGPVLSVS